MSQQGQFPGYPGGGVPGYPQRYSPPQQAVPQAPYPQPGQYPQHPHYPQQHPGAHMPMAGAPAPPPRSRRALKFLIPLCVVLALAIAGSAYYFFYSGDAPSEVVSQYITHAQDEDFTGAREFAASDANKATRFQGNSEGMETTRRWFGRDTMTWEVREQSTSGKKATVTVDKTLILPNYDDPVEMRWDYKLKRESGAWRIESIKIMSIVDDGMAGTGDCMLVSGFEYSATDCTAPASSGFVVEVTDRVDKPAECPNPVGPAVETTQHAILCLEETGSGTA